MWFLNRCKGSEKACAVQYLFCGIVLICINYKNVCDLDVVEWMEQPYEKKSIKVCTTQKVTLSLHRI